MLSSIISIIGAILLIFVVLLAILYIFCGPISFPFYILGLLRKIFWYPITLIEQVIYPVGVLPKLVLSGFVIYYVIFGLIRIIKYFFSLKNK